MKEKLIIALDFDTIRQAKKTVNDLPEAVFFKVGLQSFLQFGEDIVAYLHEKEKRLFLDLKFKDIPNTVFGAVRSSIRYQPSFLTIHLSGGREMIKRALEAAASHSDLSILGVTVLTSLSDADLSETGINLSARDEVLKLVELGLSVGLKAFVCSPQEIEPIRRRFGFDPILVTPGIRPSWSEKGDQKRFFTPASAVEAGSDYLVVGRPVTHHANPSYAFDLIAAELLSSQKTTPISSS